jgi:hypothetical protein
MDRGTNGTPGSESKGGRHKLHLEPYEIINYKLRIPREHIQGRNSSHDNPALSSMANLLEQELPLRKQRRAALL